MYLMPISEEEKSTEAEILQSAPIAQMRRCTNTRNNVIFITASLK
jgi:hypothetical protein